MNKRVVWFFEVKSNDGIWRAAVGGENVAKLLHPADESKGVEIVGYDSGRQGSVVSC